MTNRDGGSVGFIYALQSDNCDCLKIGRTDTAPGQRLTQINSSANYGPLGPWRQITSIKVADTSTVERSIHQQLTSFRSTAYPRCSELFSLTPEAVRHALAKVPQSYRPDGVKIAKLDVDQPFLNYLLRMFEVTGLENFMDQQEAWTFSLYPSTNGGRYFTLNIGKHEVAFSTPLVNNDGSPNKIEHMIYCDSLVLRDPEFLQFLASRNGEVTDSITYSSGLENGVSVYFEGNFDEVVGVFDQPTLRRGVAAYWYDALLGLRDRGSRSFFARFHNHSAVTAIMDHLRKKRAFENRKIHKFDAGQIE